MIHSYPLLILPNGEREDLEQEIDGRPRLDSKQLTSVQRPWSGIVIMPVL